MNPSLASAKSGMKIARRIHDIENETDGPVVLAVGFFDGVHVGHRKVIEGAVARAAEKRGRAWVLTFNKHPLKVLRPPAAPPLLTSTEHKLRLMEELNVKGCLILEFSSRMAKMPARCFVSLLCACAPLAEIFVGRNWRFGRGGKGDAALLRKLAGRHGVGVTVLESALWHDKPISSTRIRKEIQRGNLAAAESMLGRPFTILGSVVPGRGVARTLGFPTANLNPHNEVLPPRGVYAVRAMSQGLDAEGVLYIGGRPTFKNRDAVGGKPSVELHLFGITRNLYGKDIEVRFVKRLRDERMFHGAAELAVQIGRDATRARKALFRKSPKKAGRKLYKAAKRL